MEINLTMQDAMLHQKPAACQDEGVGRSSRCFSWTRNAGKSYLCEGARFAVSVSFLKVVSSAFLGGRPIVKMSCKSINTSSLPKLMLPVVLGRQRRSDILMADLVRARNVLASFNTPSQKRNFVLSSIESLIQYNPLNGLKMLLIDHTKSFLNDCPSFNNPYLDRAWYERNYIDYAGPVARNHWIAEKALRSLQSEMFSRLGLIAAYGMASFDEYNASAETKMPYIVAVVNEYSDFLDDDNLPLLDSILSDGYRAGIHLILSTSSRPW